MKVSEAKEKICPFITDNQGMYEKVPVKCICGDCMAWKYVKTSNTPKDAYGPGDNVPYKTDSGYCSRLSNE